MAIPTPVSFYNADESSGNASDAVGSNTLTNNGSATFVTGLIGNAMNLSRASSQSFSIADGSQTGLDITGDLTMAAWINLASDPFTNESYPIISKGFEANVARAYIFSVQDLSGTNYLYFQSAATGAGGAGLFVTWSPSTSTWYHVACVYNSSAGEVSFFVNGSQQGATQTGAQALFSGSGTFYIGYGGEYFDGKIDMAGIWNSQLTSAQLTELYNAGVGAQYPFPSASATPSSTLLLMGV